jgi:hypothetical protein
VWVPGVKLEPNDISVKGNLAHCYLFKNEYDKALKLYKELLSQKSEDQSSLKNILKQDFDFFEKSGFDKSLIEKATKELNLQ